MLHRCNRSLHRGSVFTPAQYAIHSKRPVPMLPDSLYLSRLPAFASEIRGKRSYWMRQRFRLSENPSGNARPLSSVNPEHRVHPKPTARKARPSSVRFTCT